MEKDEAYALVGNEMMEESLQDQFDNFFVSYDSDHFIWSFKGKKQYQIKDTAFIKLHLESGQRELFLEGCRQGVVEKVKTQS